MGWAGQNAESGLKRTIDGTDLSMIKLCWRALEFNPAQAQRWEEYYEALMQRYIHGG